MFGLNPWLLLGSILALSNIAGGLYIKGRMDCATARENQVLQEYINTKEELDEIRNNRPDALVVIERLQQGSF